MHCSIFDACRVDAGSVDAFRTASATMWRFTTPSTIDMDPIVEEACNSVAKDDGSCSSRTITRAASSLASTFALRTCAWEASVPFARTKYNSLPNSPQMRSKFLQRSSRCCFWRPVPASDSKDCTRALTFASDCAALLDSSREFRSSEACCRRRIASLREFECPRSLCLIWSMSARAVPSGASSSWIAWSTDTSLRDRFANSS
mmetsp:Transcript_3463/g.10092  ORF Transcript_3463/g.10092 Transcript_3463/m.10092 type:complete len:203 (+) Transcript_3463:3339-3947(+)